MMRRSDDWREALVCAAFVVFLLTVLVGVHYFPRLWDAAALLLGGQA